MVEIGIEDSYVTDQSFWGETESGNDHMQYEVYRTKLYDYKPNLQFQTILALQQLGIILAVILMVATIFMVMISLEKTWTLLLEYYNKKFGDEKVDDIEDPAALVGTFRQYKNRESIPNHSFVI